MIHLSPLSWLVSELNEFLARFMAAQHYAAAAAAATADPLRTLVYKFPDAKDFQIHHRIEGWPASEARKSFDFCIDIHSLMGRRECASVQPERVARMLLGDLTAYFSSLHAESPAKSILSHAHQLVLSDRMFIALSLHRAFVCQAVLESVAELQQSYGLFAPRASPVDAPRVLLCHPNMRLDAGSACSLAELRSTCLGDLLSRFLAWSGYHTAVITKSDLSRPPASPEASFLQRLTACSHYKTAEHHGGRSGVVDLASYVSQLQSQVAQLSDASNALATSLQKLKASGLGVLQLSEPAKDSTNPERSTGSPGLQLTANGVRVLRLLDLTSAPSTAAGSSGLDAPLALIHVDSTHLFSSYQLLFATHALQQATAPPAASLFALIHGGASCKPFPSSTPRDVTCGDLFARTKDAELQSGNSVAAADSIASTALRLLLMAHSVSLPTFVTTTHDRGHLDAAYTTKASYVLYNHSRLTSILAKFHSAVSQGRVPALPPMRAVQLSRLESDLEWRLLYWVAAFPRTIHKVFGGLLDSLSTRIAFRNSSATSPLECKLATFPEALASGLPVHFLTAFAADLCKAFSSYYDSCQVVPDVIPPEAVSQVHARVVLLQSVQRVMRQSFQLMGIEATDQL